MFPHDIPIRVAAVHPFRRLAEFVEDWKYLIDRDGARCALPTIGKEITQLPFRHLRFVILACTLDEPMPRLQPKIGLEIIPFEASHLDLVRAIHRPSEARLCHRRLEHGQYGLIALNQGQAAGYAWGCFPVAWELERVHLQLEPGDILCTDVYTAPHLRGKGVQTALTLERFRRFRELDFRRSICIIEVNNGPSLAVWQRKFGAQTVGEIDFRRVGPLYLVRCASVERPATELVNTVGGVQ